MINKPEQKERALFEMAEQRELRRREYLALCRMFRKLSWAGWACVVIDAAALVIQFRVGSPTAQVHVLPMLLGFAVAVYCGARAKGGDYE